MTISFRVVVDSKLFNIDRRLDDVILFTAYKYLLHDFQFPNKIQEQQNPGKPQEAAYASPGCPHSDV